ncbi:hypothetical protein KCP76_16840 [Salmonella enterica subsp. enterica serovar Weltevreden]|nr:hypothetical protein KCP76_16840 [Salmonella enterica subsp. enterica serovar Weltevreden]
MPADGNRVISLPVRVQNAAGAVNRPESAPARLIPGAPILVANLNHITGNVAQPLRTTLKSTVWVSSSSVLSATAGAVRLPRHYFVNAHPFLPNCVRSD